MQLGSCIISNPKKEPHPALLTTRKRTSYQYNQGVAPSQSSNKKLKLQPTPPYHKSVLQEKTNFPPIISTAEIPRSIADSRLSPINEDFESSSAEDLVLIEKLLQQTRAAIKTSLHRN